MKNISIVRNCHFKEETPTPCHETIQESHYIYFPNKTTVSVICRGFQPQIVSTEGLYLVPDQSELHSPTLTTLANRKKTIVLNRENVLLDITMKFPDRAPPLKIRKINKKRLVTQVSKTHTGTISI